MKREIGFYIHHQGLGHLMRCIRLAGRLPKYYVTFLGSGLTEYAHLIPENIRVIDLIKDVDAVTSRKDDTPREVFHYAPSLSTCILHRNNQIMAYILSARPSLFIVDVSTEVAMMARLCSLPVWIVRLHGQRRDLPHISGYRLADKLLAPYPEWMEDAWVPVWIRKKTIYLGGFSRYDSMPAEVACQDMSVVILIGKGGSSLAASWIAHIALTCRPYQFSLLGYTKDLQELEILPNLTVIPYVADPLPYLQRAKIVLAHAGDSTVMELSSLSKNFVCLPEERPFDEQMEHAKMLQRHGAALVIEDWKNPSIDWMDVLERAGRLNASNLARLTASSDLDLFEREVDRHVKSARWS